MALNINVVIIGGRVGQKPELKYTKNGKAVTEISLATNDPINKDNTLWHNLVIWGKNAENVCKYVNKGREVIIEGYNRPETYTDKEGKKRHKHTVSVFKVTFVGGNKEKKEESQAIEEDYTVQVETGDAALTFTAEDIPF